MNMTFVLVTSVQDSYYGTLSRSGGFFLFRSPAESHCNI